MKTRLTVKNKLSALILFFLAVPALGSDNLPTQVSLPPQKVFAPPGFDDNDNTQVVLFGYFPNTCYKVGQSPFVIDTNAREIRIQNFAYLYAGHSCLEMRIPWTKTIDLGVLIQGNYKILSQQTSGKYTYVANLPVAVSKTSNADDLLYAHIESATGGRDQPLRLSGSFSMDCLYVREVKTLYRSQGIIEVLPVADFIPGKNCMHTFIPLPFEVSVALKPTAKVLTLIHIRSMNGQSVNNVLQF